MSKKANLLKVSNDAEVEEARLKVFTDLEKCYQEIRAFLGSGFESMMADLCTEIIELQYKCKPGTTFLEAGLLLSMPDENTTDEEREGLKFIKAATFWYLLEKEKGILVKL